MKKIILILIVSLLPVICFSLPDNILLGWSEDLSAAKSAIIVQKIESFGLSIEGAVAYTHTPTGKTWTVANFHKSQFRGQITATKIQQIKDAVASIQYFKIAGISNPIKYLSDRNLIRVNGTP